MHSLLHFVLRHVSQSGSIGNFLVLSGTLQAITFAGGRFVTAAPTLRILILLLMYARLLDQSQHIVCLSVNFIGSRRSYICSILSPDV